MLTTVVEPTRTDRDMRAPQLKGCVVLIAGETGGVGVQIVRVSLQRGSAVVVSSALAAPVHAAMIRLVADQSTISDTILL